MPKTIGRMPWMSQESHQSYNKQCPPPPPKKKKKKTKKKREK